MKRVGLMLVLILAVMCFSGCAGNRILAVIGQKVGEADLETYKDHGKKAVEAIRGSWLFVHGEIRGVMGQSYEYDLSPYALEAAKRLDVLAAKQTLTAQEEGELVGARCRFGWYWVDHIKDKYGAPLYDQIVSVTGISLPF